MATLMRANAQWNARPEDESFLSVTDMRDFYREVREVTAEKRVDIAKLRAVADIINPNGLKLVGPSGNPFGMTNWAVKQLTQKVGVPMDYLQRIPAELAAANLNWGFDNLVSNDETKMDVLLSRTEDGADAYSFTMPTYKRVRNFDVVNAVHERFGSGRVEDGGDFTIPGEFGEKVPVTKRTTTLHGSEKDMFIFLADEERKIEVPNRRNGKPGYLSRGFFVWNSEVGADTLGCATFLFDYMCSNHIVWGAQEYREISFRHTKNIDQRWMSEAAPMLMEYAASSAKPIEEQIKRAQAFKIEDSVKFFTEKMGLGKRLATELTVIHQKEEDTEAQISNLWEASCAVTAKAKAIPFTDQRVALERVGGKILDLAA